jgi:hypothetical protein
MGRGGMLTRMLTNRVPWRDSCSPRVVVGFPDRQRRWQSGHTSASRIGGQQLRSDRSAARHQ